MARNSPQQKKEENGAAGAPAPESIDQVRDLLFGGQMRMVDARIQSLDQRIAHETNAMRNEFERQIAAIDGAFKKELAVQADRLAAERTKRSEDLKALGAEVRESFKNLEKRHQNLAETAGLADADLRDHLIKQGSTFSSELGKTSDRLSAELDRISTTLKSEKLDSAALITGLTDLAGRLGAKPDTAAKRPSRG